MKIEMILTTTVLVLVTMTTMTTTTITAAHASSAAPPLPYVSYEEIGEVHQQFINETSVLHEKAVLTYFAKVFAIFLYLV